MNEVFLVLYQVLDKPSFLNLRFNYISQLNRDNILSFSGGKGGTKHSLKNGKS